MNIRKYIRNTALVVAVIIGTSTLTFAANTYKDVTPSHWAYASITKVADKGIMVGDGTSYYPDQIVDKMESARILARVSGYSITTGYSPATKTINTLNIFKKQFPLKWGGINKDYENCIGYLYEKGILTIDDLNKFVLKYTDGTEKVKELTREEMAMFLVKTMDKKNEAIAYKGTYKFSDDKEILETTKPYVYYLKSLGVVSGDSGEKFNPKSSITKAQMAVFLDKAIYSRSDISIPPIIDNNNTTKPTNTPTSPTTPTPQKIEVTTDEGKISSVYASSNVVGIVGSNNQIKVYRLANTAKIYVDGFITTIDKLAVNMPVVVIIMNNEISEIRAQKVSVPVTGQVNGNNNSTTNNNPIAPNNNPTIDASKFVTRVCTVASTGNINDAKTISVVVQMLNPSGDIYSEEQTYILSNNCTIKRGDKDVALNTIEKDDVVNIKILGNNVYSIAVEEKNMSIIGAELISKRLNDENLPILTIKTKEGIKYDLKVTASSDMRRKGYGSVKWKELRIGDTVDVDKQYNTITYLYATGITSTVEGWVEEVVVADSSSITLKDKYGEKTKYTVYSPGDLYSITLGSKVKLTLDSKEVGSIQVISAVATSTSVQGTVDTVRYDYMYIDTVNSSSVKVIFNSATTVYDAVLGRTVSVDSLVSNMYVSVIFTNDLDKIAKTITIVSK